MAATTQSNVRRESMHKFSRRWAIEAVVFLGGLSVLALASTATAEIPIVNDTIVFKAGPGSQPDTNPCTGSPAIDYNLEGRGTIHRTVFADGTIHVLMSFHTDFLVDTIDPAEVDYSGHETDTFSFQGTNGAATTANTFTPVTTGTDGSHLVGHEVGHFTVTAAGNVTVSFDRFSWVRGCP
jgi:hypothetical protein